jgi:ATP-dependent exoDNAse (exonuclease V) alpha subunit
VDGRLIRKKSFDYSYAISTHKSQGSTFDSVFVDIRNINSCNDEAVRRQLQYVALSRTKKNVLIYQ